jgi:hypothetical protein
VGPPIRSGRGGEEKNSQLLPVLEPPIIQPVVQRSTTELCRLSEYVVLFLYKYGRNVRCVMSVCRSCPRYPAFFTYEQYFAGRDRRIAYS